MCALSPWSQAGKKVNITAKGTRSLSAKNEDFGILYINFCPAHAHNYGCTSEGDMCKKWGKIIKARQSRRAEAKTSAQQRQGKRAATYSAAVASSSTTFFG